jgi:carbonic anhydrase
MNKLILCSAITLISYCSGAALAAANDKPHWGYEGKNGPSNWVQLSPEYGACSGSNQSPVNLSGFVEADLAPINFKYSAGGKEVINNGHTVQVNYDEGSYIVVDDIQFNLAQFHRVKTISMENPIPWKRILYIRMGTETLPWLQ